MHHKLDAPWTALKLGIGLMATFAGLDKFFNLLTDWTAYLSPLAAQVLPVAPATFMGVVGVIEIAVGVAILTGWTRAAAYVASVWLVCIAANLATAGFLDIAVRDVVLSIAAFTLARLAEVREQSPARSVDRIIDPRRVTA
jgi:uncharacterized membrane protein YphA (DoxX/SURF4 family)